MEEPKKRKKITAKRVSPRNKRERMTEGMRVLNSFASQIAEHFTSVQIVCTNLEPDGTTTRVVAGSGDVYARTRATESMLRELEERLP